MKIKDLIKELSKFDPELEATITDGFKWTTYHTNGCAFAKIKEEDGFETVDIGISGKIVANINELKSSHVAHNTAPTWIIEDFLDDSDYKELIAEVKKQGYPCIVLNASNQFKLDLSRFSQSDKVIFYGSIQLAQEIKKKLPNAVWLAEENYLCSAYYPLLGRHLFNDKYAFVQVKEIQRQKWFYYQAFGKEALIFIRPNDGKKTFTGQLLDLQEFDRFFENDLVCNSRDEDFVVVSSPKAIKGEWRFICHEKEIIAVSCYQFQGQKTQIPSAPEGATQKCLEVLSEGYWPDKAFTVDICEDSTGQFWLLELNSFCSAGVYSANKRKIVKRISEIAQAR